MAYCKSCGNTVNGTKYCNVCGAKISDGKPPKESDRPEARFDNPFETMTYSGHVRDERATCGIISLVIVALEFVFTFIIGLVQNYDALLRMAYLFRALEIIAIVLAVVSFVRKEKKAPAIVSVLFFVVNILINIIYY